MKATRKDTGYFWAPATAPELASYCLRIIGQGDTFCINKNCQIAHQKNNGQENVAPKDVFILKTKDLAFVGAKINANSLSDDIIHEWTQDTNSLDY